MTNIQLKLKDDEFLQLGAMAFAVNAWANNPAESSFGRLALKLQTAIRNKATPGQMAHFERMVECLQVVKEENTVDVMMVEDGMEGVFTSMFEQMNPDDEQY